MLKHAIPASLVLETDKVLLRAISARDIQGYNGIVFAEPIWKYFVSNIATEADLLNFVEQGIADTHSGIRFVFSIMDKVSGLIAGSTSFGNISPRDGRLEIGWSWVGQDYAGTHVNRHTKYCLMKYAFEKLEASRVEFKTDVLNLRARKALTKIGAVEEGVLRSHTLMPAGRRRDTIFYSVLADEWPGVRATAFADLP